MYDWWGLKLWQYNNRLIAEWLSELKKSSNSRLNEISQKCHSEAFFAEESDRTNYYLNNSLTVMVFSSSSANGSLE
jgi:hypothetical protein